MPAISSLKEGSSHNKKVNPKLIESNNIINSRCSDGVYLFA